MSTVQLHRVLRATPDKLYRAFLDPQALAVALDAAGLPSLAGSVAGYDTIFVAPTDPSRLEALEEEVRRCLENGF